MIKTNVRELAIFGDAPLFGEPLHVGRPNIASRRSFLSRVDGILDRCWLTNDGPMVREFERRLAERIGVEHCIAVCNATVGLELLMRSCDLKGEVIVPSFTFIATVHAIQCAGLTPVFIDIDEETHCLDVKNIEKLISNKTAAILGVHLWGRCCDPIEVERIAERYDLTALFDAAHAFDCSYQNRMVGTFGRAEVFSFHATKFLNSIEGGAIATTDGELAENLRLRRNFGFSGYDQVITLGTNAKMSEVAAAMGLSNLDNIDRILSVNRNNYELYRRHLQGLPGVKILRQNDRSKCNLQYVVFEIDEPEAGIGRDQLIQLLHAENVLARRYFFPGCHLLEPYCRLYPDAKDNLPVTDRVAYRILQVPTGLAVGPDEIAAISSVIRLAIEEAPAIKNFFAGRRGLPR